MDYPITHHSSSSQQYKTGQNKTQDTGFLFRPSNLDRWRSSRSAVMRKLKKHTFVMVQFCEDVGVLLFDGKIDENLMSFACNMI